jgi:phosphatidylserine decarboxylase
LKSEKSAKVFNEGKEGWFGETAKPSLAEVANIGETNLAFEELFVCDPSKPHYGFNSWDAWVSALLLFLDVCARKYRE